MDQAIAALLGTVTGFLLPSLASYLRARTRGARFENALRGELEDARETARQKLLWLGRDQRPWAAITDEKLLVEFEGKLLYLGEDEDFTVQLPFWDQNLRDIVEATSTRAFNRICREVALLRRFALKFREMKLAFKVDGGNPKAMALACYRDLIAIQDELLRA